MNYISQLLDEIETLKAEIRRRNANDDAMLAYLQSSKFANDTTVQVVDIINAIRENRSQEISHNCEPKAFYRITNCSNDTYQDVHCVAQISGFVEHELLVACIENKGETQRNEENGVLITCRKLSNDTTLEQFAKL